MRMRLVKERKYWEDNFLSIPQANEVFFRWYDSIRLNLFDVRKELFSLEIGPGRGHFTKKASVNVIVDFSLNALLKIKKDYDGLMVVANAAQLPFKEGCFYGVYANDIMHHLKAEDVLNESCSEIKRVLKPGGFFCVSDRRPSLYNSFLLLVNALARSLLKTVMKVLNKKVLFSGSDNEPSMTKKDYSMIYKTMDIVAEKRWKSWIVFWLYGAQQFVNLLIPASAQFKLAKILKRICVRAEEKFSDRYKTDICLILRKRRNLK
jgi:SAM-dependent methyltransferase